MSKTITENQDGVSRLIRGMPSLDHLETSLRSKRELGKLLGVHAQPSGRAGQLADGYVRLIEKTILEYKEARRSLIAFLTDGTADHLHRAQDHFESCIQALHRALNYLDRLRKFGYKLQDGMPFIPRPRELEVLRETVKKPVRCMRDALEHLDEDILNGVLSEDSPAGPHLGWDTAMLGTHKLSYADVAQWIEQLHKFAALLSRVNLQVGPTPTAGSDSGK
ncbi:MAG: hypothetical protein QNK15_00780 [Cycloclasticus sp.]|nr:hypothetical protein [Cycloclasticus sp.]